MKGRSTRKERARRRRRSLRGLLLLALLAETLGPLLGGGRFGRDVVVRCRQGHLFTTIWIPFGSLKAVRLGRWRYQRCPVGRHWTLVRPVHPGELSAEEVRVASEHRDLRIP